jgi:Flp pilus assembly protein TadD
MMSAEYLELVASGRESIKAGEPEKAEAAFRNAIDLSPQEPDAWNGLGALAFERGDLDESLASFEHAKSLAVTGAMPASASWSDPEDKPLLRAIHGIGLNLFRSGDLAGAKEQFALLLRLNPSDEQGAAMQLDSIAKKEKPWKQ